MAEVIHRYIRRGEPLPEPSKEQKEREESDARFAAARAKKEEALATLREAEVLRKRRELISRDTATKQASFLFVTLRERLLALPAQLARKLNVPDKHQARMIIDSAIRNCLIELSELPDRITQEHYKDFIETENGKKTPKSSPKRKAA